MCRLLSHPQTMRSATTAIERFMTASIPIGMVQCRRTFALCQYRSVWSAWEDVVDDADHDRAHRTVRRFEDLARAVALVEDDDALVRAGADGVDGDEVVAALLALHDEQAPRVVERVLDRPVDLADDAAEDH